VRVFIQKKYKSTFVASCPLIFFSGPVQGLETMFIIDLQAAFSPNHLQNSSPLY
jgi:hypothetical protein